MNKRGQFYIIIALIIALALFGITYKVNEIQEPILFNDFNDVSQNYITESTKVVNDALKGEETDVKDRVDSFTVAFLDYAKQRSPDIGLLYIYSDGETVYFRNELGENIGINEGVVLGGEVIQGITLEVGGNEFVHQVPVTASDFGDDWVSEFISSGPMELSIGGIVDSFRLGDGNDFRIIIRAESGEYVCEPNEDGCVEFSPLMADGENGGYAGNVQQKTNF